jgi:hypothetical protein
MLCISRRSPCCGIRLHSSIRACLRSWRVCGGKGHPQTLLLSLFHTCLMGLRLGLTAGHSISWMSSSRKTALVMHATWALALSCMSTNSGPTQYAATNTCYSNIYLMYPAAVRLPRTMTRSVRPTILMPPHTITEPCPEGGRLPGQHLACTAHHDVSRHAVSGGNLDLSVNNTGLHWQSCQLTWLRANRRWSVRCCCVKWDTWTGRLGRMDTSLNLFLTVWSDTMRSCCSSLAVVEWLHNAQISVILWGCHVSTTLSNPPCELACLIVAIPQAVNNWPRDIEIRD